MAPKSTDQDNATSVADLYRQVRRVDGSLYIIYTGPGEAPDGLLTAPENDTDTVLGATLAP